MEINQRSRLTQSYVLQLELPTSYQAEAQASRTEEAGGQRRPTHNEMKEGGNEDVI